MGHLGRPRPAVFLVPVDTTEVGIWFDYGCLACCSKQGREGEKGSITYENRRHWAWAYSQTLRIAALGCISACTNPWPSITNTSDVPCIRIFLCIDAKGGSNLRPLRKKKRSRRKRVKISDRAANLLHRVKLQRVFLHFIQPAARRIVMGNWRLSNGALKSHPGPISPKQREPSPWRNQKSGTVSKEARPPPTRPKWHKISLRGRVRVWGRFGSSALPVRVSKSKDRLRTRLAEKKANGRQLLRT